ncbi:hypothetical protein SUDANB120_06098 [Streptomyces sp. enrichment culture]
MTRAGPDPHWRHHDLLPTGDLHSTQVAAWMRW